MHKSGFFYPKTSLIAFLIAATTLSMTLPVQGWALLAPVQGSVRTMADDAARKQDLATVQKALESKILRQRLQDFGLSPEETNRRITQLSDSQVHQLAMQAQKLNPAGDGGLGLLVALLVIGILVLLFIYLFKRV
jgi:hypothetical protein